jgi:hypothetical protein
LVAAILAAYQHWGRNPIAFLDGDKLIMIALINFGAVGDRPPVTHWTNGVADGHPGNYSVTLTSGGRGHCGVAEDPKRAAGGSIDKL